MPNSDFGSGLPNHVNGLPEYSKVGADCGYSHTPYQDGSWEGKRIGSQLSTYGLLPLAHGVGRGQNAGIVMRGKVRRWTSDEDESGQGHSAHSEQSLHEVSLGGIYAIDQNFTITGQYNLVVGSDTVQRKTVLTDTSPAGVQEDEEKGKGQIGYPELGVRVNVGHGSEWSLLFIPEVLLRYARDVQVESQLAGKKRRDTMRQALHQQNILAVGFKKELNRSSQIVAGLEKGFGRSYRDADGQVQQLAKAYSTVGFAWELTRQVGRQRWTPRAGLQMQGGRWARLAVGASLHNRGWEIEAQMSQNLGQLSKYDKPTPTFTFGLAYHLLPEFEMSSLPHSIKGVNKGGPL